MPAAILEVENLRTYFRQGGEADGQPNKAVEGVSFTLREGETLGVVGRTGSGKSVLARSIMGLVSEPGYVAGGSIRFRGQELVGLPDEKYNTLRGSDIALIVSNPRARLNPLLSVGKQLANVVRAKRALDGKAAFARGVELLKSVSIADPARVAHMLPHELSGGMCQRVVIAMALAHSPRLLLADEPTAGLDVTIQMQVLELMAKLVRERGSALLLMSRDLGVVAHYGERVAVLMEGKIVEESPVREFFNRPKHPHSSYLLKAAFAARGEREG
jgi:ABC-type dipeptide/oligopeptide/nickel transport system ATPase component